MENAKRINYKNISQQYQSLNQTTLDFTNRPGNKILATNQRVQQKKTQISKIRNWKDEECSKIIFFPPMLHLVVERSEANEKKIKIRKK